MRRVLCGSSGKRMYSVAGNKTLPHLPAQNTGTLRFASFLLAKDRYQKIISSISPFIRYNFFDVRRVYRMRLPILVFSAVLLCITCVPSTAQTANKTKFSQKNFVAGIRKAAEQGFAEAQFNLGLDYDRGEGVPKDEAQAAIWYRKSAEQGDADAQTNLGLLYATGKGVPQDHAQAAVWFRKAAEQGVAKAQYNLGWMYNNGQGLPQDYAEAAVWYRKSAEQEDAEAQ